MTEAISSQAPKKKLLLVSSSGGHLKHLTATSAAWQNYDRVWVSFKQPDVESSLADEKTYWAYYPTTRNIKCFDRPTLPTMTGKMLYTFADRIIVQSEEQQENFPDSRVIHPIF